MFTFIHTSDTHAHRGNIRPELREVLDEYLSHPIDFVVDTGDMVGGRNVEGQQQLLEEIRTACEAKGVEYHHSAGECDAHEHDDPEKAVRWFRHKGWIFLLLDRYFGSYERFPRCFDMSVPALDRLQNALLSQVPRTDPLILCTHEAPVGITSFIRGEVMLRCLRYHKLVAVLCGHVHGNLVSQYDSVPFISVSGPTCPYDCSPRSYNVVTCNDDGTVRCTYSAFGGVPHRPAPVQNRSATPVQLSGPWESHRGPDGTRSTTAVCPSAQPRPAWTTKLAGSICVGAPTLTRDGTLVVGTRSKGGLEECGVWLLDAATGKMKWGIQTDGSVDGGVALSGDRGYFGTSAGSLYCIDTMFATRLWKWNNGDNLPIACEPFVDGDLVHVGANWEMYALEADTGHARWRALSSQFGSAYFSPGHASPVVHGNRVYHSRPSNREPMPRHAVQSVTRDLGKELVESSVKLESWPNKRNASPLVWRNYIVAVGQGFACLDPDSLEITGPHANGPPVSATPAIAGDLLYLTTATEIRAHALDRAGGLVWRASLGEPGFGFIDNYSSPLALPGQVIVCDTGGAVRALSSESGAELWRIDIGVPIASAPIMSGNALFICDYDGTVHAFTWESLCNSGSLT